MQATVAVYTSGSISSSEGDAVSFPWVLHEINTSWEHSYVVCWRQICILLLLIVLAGLLKSRMDCKVVQCSNRKCWEPHRFPCKNSFGELRFRHLKVWREANFSNPRGVNKKAVTYHKWCGSSESGPTRGSPFSIPSYLYKDLDKQVLRNSSWFRLRAHHVKVLQMAWWF